MNTESKAGHAALGTTERSAANDFNSSRDKLVADLKILKADAEKMIKEAADSSAEGYAVLRTRLEGKLADAKVQLGQAKAAVGDKAQYAATAAHAYVKENPLQSAGILAAAGAMFGFLLGRKSSARGVDAPKE
jgi:ElaB/YqjD/DUF883 family membrane-anchored ribosome-binding protein